MKMRVDRQIFIEEFKRYERDNHFSYWGMNKLFDYIEEYEENCGEGYQYELDVIALCCEYVELPIDQVLKDYLVKSIEELREATEVVAVDEGRILFRAY